MAEPPEYVTREQLAKILGVKPAKVDDLRERGLPWLRWGHRTVRFEREVALRWVNQYGYREGSDVHQSAA